MVKRLKDVTKPLGETFGHSLITPGATTAFGAFVAQEVTEARRPAHNFAGLCELKPFGDGLSRFLHESKR